MTIIVAAAFVPAEGRREDLLAALRNATVEMHAEQGCELYALHDGADGTLWFLEKWSTEADLDAHGAGEPVRRLNIAIADLVASPPVVTRMLPVLVSTTRQGQL